MRAARVRELLQYDSDTGRFTWRVARRNVRAGDLAGQVSANGYVTIGVDGKRYMAHRLAWLWETGAWPADEIDHINGDRVDNRMANLRDVTRRTNTENLRHAQSNNKLGMLGVARSGSRFRAQIYSNRAQIYLGTFDTPEAAHAAYVAAKRDFHPGGML